ncbi:12769_t:CDS:2, partial [Ambispora gerdemannii]
MIADESNDSHENKRVKITTACDTCRRRKVKCDGASPCANCGRGGYQCTFSDASTKRPRGPPKGFVALIEERLHNIESLLVKEAKQEQSKETGDRRKYNSTNNNTHLVIPSTPPADVLSLLEPQEPFGDDLGSDDEEDVQKILTGFTANNYQDNLLHLSHQPGSYSEPEIPSSLPRITPPPQDVVNQLLEKFFTHFHPFFPIIDRTQLYQQLQSTDNQPSPLLMNAIYAVGASYPPILQDSYSPTTFYELAKNLLDYFLDAPRLSTVQALILLCMVDQGKTSSFRPQSYSFMAIRMAQSMRLNRKNGAIYYQNNNRHTKKL